MWRDQSVDLLSYFRRRSQPRSVAGSVPVLVRDEAGDNERDACHEPRQGVEMLVAAAASRCMPACRPWAVTLHPGDVEQQRPTS